MLRLILIFEVKTIYMCMYRCILGHVGNIDYRRVVAFVGKAAELTKQTTYRVSKGMVVKSDAAIVCSQDRARE